MEGYKLVLVNGDDWEGIYINGELFYEGHSIPTDVMVDVIMSNKFFTSYVSASVDSEWLEDNGGLPLYLKDIPEEVLT